MPSVITFVANALTAIRHLALGFGYIKLSERDLAMLNNRFHRWLRVLQPFGCERSLIEWRLLSNSILHQSGIAG